MERIPVVQMALPSRHNYVHTRRVFLRIQWVILMVGLQLPLNSSCWVFSGLFWRYRLVGTNKVHGSSNAAWGISRVLINQQNLYLATSVVPTGVPQERSTEQPVPSVVVGGQTRGLHFYCQLYLVGVYKCSTN